MSEHERDLGELPIPPPNHRRCDWPAHLQGWVRKRDEVHDNALMVIVTWSTIYRSSSGATITSWPAFARKQPAIDWPELRSFNDESRFTVHTAAEVIGAF